MFFLFVCCFFSAIQNFRVHLLQSDYKFRELRNLQSFLDLISRVNVFENFAWISRIAKNGMFWSIFSVLDYEPPLSR